MNKHRPDNIEDMSNYCPQRECDFDCEIIMCDSFGPVYENCDCEKCRKQRKKMNRVLSYKGKWKRLDV